VLKRLFRWGFRLLVLAIMLVVALLLLKDTLLRSWAEWRVRRQTGLSTTIRRFDLGLLSPTFTMEGFRIYNPPEFGGSVLFDIPEVHFEYDSRQAFQGKLHLNTLRFNLRELNIVRNAQGQTNLFTVLSQATSAAAKGTNTPGAARGRRLNFDGIDRLYLSVGTVRYTDQQQPANSWQRDLNWKEFEIKNVRTPDDARNWGLLLVMRAMVSPPQKVAPAPAASRPAPR
jgi:uncharacterized protein involved in outer membrane biogenesis